MINDAEILKPFLASKGHPAEEVDRMYQAWGKSVLPELAGELSQWDECPRYAVAVLSFEDIGSVTAA